MMLKILLADSDLENIKNFKKYIKMKFPDFRIVGSLQSPMRFLDELKELQPQLVVADIRFFGVSSYQLIRDTYDLYPNVRFILYGTYNDADYMEQVMEFGVIDYMYRPVKPLELERSLNRAMKAFIEIEKMHQDEDTLVANYNKQLNLFLNQFLLSLLHGHIENDFEIESSFSYFDVNLTPSYTVFIVRIDHYKKLLLAMDDMDKHLLIYRMLLIVEDKLKKLKTGVAAINRFNAITVIVGKSISLYDLIDFCTELKSDILTQCRIPVSIGIGQTYEKSSEINISYKEAKAAIRYRHYVGYNSVIPLHFVEPLNNITYKYPVEKEELLVYSAVAGEYENCESILKQLLDSLKNCGNLPDKLLSKIVVNILISINRFASEQRIVQNQNFSSFFPSKEAFEVKTPDEAYIYLSSAIKKFCEHINQIRTDEKKNLLEKAKEYIENQYYENITLAGLASHFETTVEFLGNVFMEFENKSFYSYIISIRMKQAKKLMRETEMGDEAVAVNVGYTDVKQFRSAFKQYEGMYTHEYKGRYNVNIAFRNK